MWFKYGSAVVVYILRAAYILNHCKREIYVTIFRAIILHT